MLQQIVSITIAIIIANVISTGIITAVVYIFRKQILKVYMKVMFESLPDFDVTDPE